MMKNVRGFGKGLCVLSALLLMFAVVGCDDSDSTDVGLKATSDPADLSEITADLIAGKLIETGGKTDTTGAESKGGFVPPAGTAMGGDDKKVQSPEATVKVTDQASFKGIETIETPTITIPEGEEFVPLMGMKIESKVKYFELPQNDTSNPTITVKPSAEVKDGDVLYISYTNTNGEKNWIDISKNDLPSFDSEKGYTINLKTAGLLVDSKLYMPEDIVIGQVVKKVTVALGVSGPEEDDCYVSLTPSVTNDAKITKVGYKIWVLMEDDTWSLSDSSVLYNEDPDTDDEVYKLWAPVSSKTYRVLAQIYYEIDGKTSMKEIRYKRLSDVICETGSGSV